MSMLCKSCSSPVPPNVAVCTVCGITNPLPSSTKRKRWLLLAAVVGVIVIVIVPMIASLLWMQTSK